jgi:diguanylate cyclase (GGDEF)-like protein
MAIRVYTRGAFPLNRVHLKPETRTYLSYIVAAAIPFLLFFGASDMNAAPILRGSALAGLREGPWVALGILGFLGWRLNQTRILISAMLLMGILFLLGSQARTALGLSGDNLSFALSMALPASLCIVFATGEAPLFSQRSLLRVFLALLPFLILAGAAGIEPDNFTKIVRWEAYPLLGKIKVPQAALIALLLYGLLSLFTLDKRARPFMRALAIALWPVLLSMESSLYHRNAEAHDPFVVLSFLFSSGILLWAIFSMYWQRVYLDELTGIANRRALDEKLANLESDYALTMVDIDHFKKFNDTYGHEEGDNVLRLVARHLNDGSGGRAFRYGGEEFCLVFEGWTVEEAAKHADEIRAALAKRSFSIRLPQKIRKKTSADDRGSLHAKSVKVPVTVSMGVASPGKKRLAAKDVIKSADEGLYEAKEKGRNCVVQK